MPKEETRQTPKPPKPENPHKHHRERMRQKYLQSNSLSVFSEHEMLELLLYYCVAQKNTNEMAHHILDKYGSLTALFDADPAELARTCGMTLNQAVLISLIRQFSDLYVRSKVTKENKVFLYTTSAAGNYCARQFYDKTKEHALIVCLDNRYKILRSEFMEKGTLTKVLLDPRKITETAIRFNAKYIILAHNHPTGDPESSPQDFATTKSLIEILDPIGIYILDHFIIGIDVYRSMSRAPEGAFINRDRKDIALLAGE